MPGIVDALTLGNRSEVKVVLATALAAAALIQVALISVAYGRVRLGVLAAGPAAQAHRAIGDTIVTVTLIVSFFCVSYFGFEAEEADSHVPIALLLLGVLALKIAVVRWWRRLDPLLPLLGIAVLVLFVATWESAAAQYLV